MMISRRSVIRVVAASVPAMLVGARAAWPMYATPSAEVITAVLQHHFGTAVANDVEAKRFARDAHKLMQMGLRAPRPDNIPDTFEFHIVTLFLQSTTILAHLKNGAPLEHFGVFHPDLTPCQSQLVAELA